MAAFSSPHGQYCPHCGTSIDPGTLVCGHCRQLIHSAELDQLAARARQLAAIGQLHAARDLWSAALRLLPPASAEYRGVRREIERLNARISPPPPRIDWKKRLGPIGIGLAGIAKFKAPLLLLLTKGKFLFSMLLFIGFYWGLFGWWFAVGLGGSVLLHEMGHYLVVRRFGFRAELPVFIPGLAAYVKWNGSNVDPSVRAQISLAGPLFGFISGLLAYGLFLSTHRGVWLGVAEFAGWLNLINLVPVGIFDGGSAMSALGRQHRLAILVLTICLAFLLHSPMFLFVTAGTAYRIWKRDFPTESRQGIAYYFGALVIANGFLNWFCSSQAARHFLAPVGVG